MKLLSPFICWFMLTLSTIAAQSPQQPAAGHPGASSITPANMREVSAAIGHPEAAINAGITGKVVIRVLVDKQGHYVRHKVIESPSDILTRACEAHITDLVFTPVTIKGKPTKYWINLPFAFKLTSPE